MAWNDRYRIRLEPKTKTDYWFSKYNRVLLHYSVSINATAATAAHIPLSAAAVACISLSQGRQRRKPLGQRLLGYLVEIPKWERGRDRKHPWSTTQHLEQLRSYPKGNHPLSVLWRHFTSRDDTFGHVTSGSHATFGHEQWYILYYYYSQKKPRGCTYGHAQNILPVMTSLPITWLHVTSFPVWAASGDVTSSNACVMARSPLLSPKYALSYPDILLWYLDLGGPYAYPMKNYRRTAKSKV
jgi:hypothetical protein